MSWDDVRNAIQTTIVAASGLPAGQVIWKWQNADQPPLSYIAMGLTPMTTVGLDWLKQTLDLSRPAGQEFQISTQGIREVGLELTAFTQATASISDASALLDITKTSLLLPSIRKTLTAAGISPFDPGPVNFVPEIAGAKFRGRAICLIRCYVPAQVVSEYVGYIRTVRGDIDYTGGANPSPPPYPWSDTIE